MISIEQRAHELALLKVTIDFEIYKATNSVEDDKTFYGKNFDYLHIYRKAYHSALNVLEATEQ